MNDCSKHKREVAGVSDMKELATMIGDLHYETLSELLWRLRDKLLTDATRDHDGSRPALGGALNRASFHITKAEYAIREAWQISKPHMDNHQ